MTKNSITKLSQSCVRQAKLKFHQAQTARTRNLEIKRKQSAILNLNLAIDLKAMADATDHQAAFEGILEEICQTEEYREYLLQYLSCGKLM